MKKLIILIAVILVVAIAFIIIAPKPTNLVSEYTPTPQAIVSSPTNQPTPIENTLETQSLEKGEYIYYNQDSFNEDIKYNKVVLFFYASWCPTCAILQNELNSSKDRIPDGVRIIRVPYDDVSGANQETLAMNSKYGVTYQHTLVQIDSNGELLKKWNGSSNLDEILNKIQ